jgi:hypothetical protein
MIPACYFHGVPIYWEPDDRPSEQTFYVVPDTVPDNSGLDRLCKWLHLYCNDVITVSEMEAMRA